MIERLIDAICAFDWPKDKLEIQVLDDSTDDTVDDRPLPRSPPSASRASTSCTSTASTAPATRPARCARATVVAKRRASSPSSTPTSCPTRTSCARRSTTSRIPTVGFVQTRWDYLNREYGMLTQGMGMLMDGHFVLEQVTRSRGGYVFNFNGTGGIWRKQAIRRCRRLGGRHDLRGHRPLLPHGAGGLPGGVPASRDQRVRASCPSRSRRSRASSTAGPRA